MESPSGRLSLGSLLYTRHSTTIANTSLALAVLCSVAIIGWLTWRSGQIYYTNVGAGVQLARPGEVPRQAIADLSLAIVRLLGNVTPEGLPSAIQAAMEHMTAHFRVKFESDMRAQLEEMQDGNIVMLTENLAVDRIVRTKKEGVTVYQTYISAQRRLMSGAIRLDPHEVMIMVESYPVIIARHGVYGLWVNDMHWPGLDRNKGDMSQAPGQHRPPHAARRNSVLGQ